MGRLVDFYLHDFSEFDGRDVQADGSYHYEWLDAYWTDADRKAYLFDVDEHPAGFALVRLIDPLEMAEFFMLRKYRRSGIGTAAARDVIARHPGPWIITQVPGNEASMSFWRRAIPVPFEERRHADGHVEQRFTAAG
ncbi:GNAT family N-acetyltransferase [Rathayibacter sp. CAU 1779]